MHDLLNLRKKIADKHIAEQQNVSKVELDKIDRKILEVLQTNGRLTNLEVAERVNLSPSPCLRRIRRLEEIGVIRQYAALLEPNKIGLGLLAYINVRLEKQGGTPKGKGTIGSGTGKYKGIEGQFDWQQVVALPSDKGTYNYVGKKTGSYRIP